MKMSSKLFCEKVMGQALFLKLTGDGDSDLALLESGRLSGRLNESCTKIVLDLERVVVFYSAAINRLVESFKAVRAAGGELYLINVPDRVRAILTGVHLDTTIKIYRSEYDFILDHNLVKVADPSIYECAEATEILTFEIRREVMGSIHTYRILGSLIEEYHMKELYDRTTLSMDEGATEIVVDLGKTSFIDSVNIATFIRIRKLCAERKVSFCVKNANRLVTEVFNLTGIGSMLETVMTGN